MLLVNVHELQVVLANAVIFAALEDQVQHIRGVLGLEGQDILVLSSAQHLGEGGEVETEGNVAVAAVGGKSFCLEHHGDQGDVGVVHGLQGNTRVVAIEVAVLDEVLDGINHLVRSGAVSIAP